MIRSETRGVARGAMPKRSRSERGPPVCIISIAQQARPNIMYQTDDFRVQLRKSSILVVSAISGAVLISDIAFPLRGVAPERLGSVLATILGQPRQPLPVCLPPDVPQADAAHQPAQNECEQEEDEHVGELEVHPECAGILPPFRESNDPAVALPT